MYEEFKEFNENIEIPAPIMKSKETLVSDSKQPLLNCLYYLNPNKKFP